MLLIIFPVYSIELWTGSAEGEPLLENEDKFDVSLEDVRIKEEFGIYVTKSNMNHSDKKCLGLKASQIHFGYDNSVPVNYQPESVLSEEL